MLLQPFFNVTVVADVNVNVPVLYFNVAVVNANVTVVADVNDRVGNVNVTVVAAANINLTFVAVVNTVMLQC